MAQPKKKKDTSRKKDKEELIDPEVEETPVVEELQTDVQTVETDEQQIVEENIEKPNEGKKLSKNFKVDKWIIFAFLGFLLVCCTAVTATFSVLTYLKDKPVAEKGEKGDAGAPGSNGKDGNPGTDGKNGTNFLQGPNNPENSVGSDGDTFLNTTTCDLFIKSNSIWVRTGTIETPVETFEVKFMFNGEQYGEIQEIPYGGKIVCPENPEIEEYHEFYGWMIDGYYIGEENDPDGFSVYTVTSDITLTGYSDWNLAYYTYESLRSFVQSSFDIDGTVDSIDLVSFSNNYLYITATFSPVMFEEKISTRFKLKLPDDYDADIALKEAMNGNLRYYAYEISNSYLDDFDPRTNTQFSIKYGDEYTVINVGTPLQPATDHRIDCIYDEYNGFKIVQNVVIDEMGVLDESEKIVTTVGNRDSLLYQVLYYICNK